MHESKPNPLAFLKSPQARVLSVLLLLQASVFYALPKEEEVPLSRPLSEIPTELAGWTMVREQAIESEVLGVLKADDTLSRVYASPTGDQTASLLAVFFKSQRAGVSPHSPKVCLPGAGWVPVNSGELSIPIEGRGTIPVNRYEIVKGDQSMLVLYWYQNSQRVMASEYSAKVYSLWDGITQRRSDTSMVRLIVPIDSRGAAAAQETAIKFVQGSFGTLSEYLPRQV